MTERLELVEKLWASIVEDSDELTLTRAQADELDRRVADYEANREGGVKWEEFRNRLINIS